MANAYTKVASPQLLEDCPNILNASLRINKWLQVIDIDFHDYLDDNTRDEMRSDIFGFCHTLEEIGRRPTSSKLQKRATQLFDHARAMSRSIAILDHYFDEHPELPQSAYAADRDAFVQSLSKFD